MTTVSTQHLPGPFGPAIDLLPKEQRIEKVRHDEPVSNAIERMSDNEFSQLPVEQSGKVVGIFSWRSLGKVVGGKIGESNLDGLSVGDCLASVQFLPPNAYIDTDVDWTEQDCVLIGSPKEMVGLLAIYDVVGRLQDFGEAFFLIHEIEHLIRQMLTDAVGENRLKDILTTMSVPPKFPQPSALTDLTFALYATVFCSKSRWKEFEPMFLGDVVAWRDAIGTIGGIRNVVFHFKRPVTVSDVDELRRFRNKLKMHHESFRHRAE